jgi:IclR family pca regulon transcriptional regulator
MRRDWLSRGVLFVPLENPSIACQSYSVEIKKNLKLEIHIVTNFGRTSESNIPKQPEYIEALARGLSVIRAFTDQRESLTISEIASIVALSRATARRCLITLTRLGYIDTSGKYFRLTAQSLLLSRAYLTSNPLPRIAQSWVERLGEELKEACSLSVLNRNDIICVARSTQQRAPSVDHDIGQRVPAYCTSMGRVLLAQLSDAALDSYFRNATMKKFTHRTVVDEYELRGLIKQVKVTEFCLAVR